MASYAYGTFKSTRITYTNINNKSVTVTLYVAPSIYYERTTGNSAYSYAVRKVGFALRADSAGTTYFSEKLSQPRTSSVSVSASGSIKASTGNSISLSGSKSIPIHSLYTSTSKEYFIEASSTFGVLNVARTYSSQTFSVSSSENCTFNTTNLSNHTIYSDTVPAKPSYTITLNGNGGTSTSATKWYDETLSISGYSSTRTGYTFNGWYTATSGGSKVTSVTANSAATYYAQWTEKTATLTYNNGGHGTAPGNVTMKYTAATYASAAITATGYNFTGWKRSDNGTVISAGAQVKAANVVPSALTLTAQWSKKIATPFIKIDGLWIKGSFRVKAGGQWYECTKGYIKIGDEWKQLN